MRADGHTALFGPIQGTADERADAETGNPGGMARLHFPRGGKHTKDATADAPTGERSGEDYGPDAATERAAPDSPTELPGLSLIHI